MRGVSVNFMSRPGLPASRSVRSIALPQLVLGHFDALVGTMDGLVKNATVVRRPQPSHFAVRRPPPSLVTLQGNALPPF